MCRSGVAPGYSPLMKNCDKPPVNSGGPFKEELQGIIILTVRGYLMAKYHCDQFYGSLVKNKGKGKHLYEGHLYLPNSINIFLKGYISGNQGNQFLALKGRIHHNYITNTPVSIDSTMGYVKANKCFIEGSKRRTHDGKLVIGGAIITLSLWRQPGVNGKYDMYTIEANKSSRKFKDSINKLYQKMKPVSNDEGIIFDLESHNVVYDGVVITDDFFSEVV
jgi:hypothetical protein